jgi:hypothetical protein
MTTTEQYRSRLPQRQAALAKAGQNKRTRSEALAVEDLYRALSAKTGVRHVRRALHEHLGFEPFTDDVARLVEAAMPDAARAVREREEAEAKAAEQRRRQAAREAAAARKAADEEERLRRAVEAARQRRQADYEAELEAEAHAALEAAKR